MTKPFNLTLIAGLALLFSMAAFADSSDGLIRTYEMKYIEESSYKNWRTACTEDVSKSRVCVELKVRDKGPFTVGLLTGKPERPCYFDCVTPEFVLLRISREDYEKLANQLSFVSTAQPFYIRFDLQTGGLAMGFDSTHLTPVMPYVDAPPSCPASGWSCASVCSYYYSYTRRYNVAGKGTTAAEAFNDALLKCRDLAEGESMNFNLYVEVKADEYISATIQNSCVKD